MITAILLGAGNRGEHAYGHYALQHPEEIRFVGVADANPVRLESFSKKHQISKDKQFKDYKDILNQPKMADACFICLQDKLHYEPALKAIELGYDLFLEKPMAVNAPEVIAIFNHAKKYKKNVMVGHVLRYTDFFNAIKQIIAIGEIGDIMTIQHNENVSYWHQAHSYVRGNWRNVETASPMILAKSCHDMDILSWLVESKPTKVASFGSLSHFRKETMTDVPNFCMDGCKHQNTCPYFAPKVYLNASDWMKFPVSDDISDEAILKALKKGPYGRCVYRSDNDVVDHQVVSIEFENKATASFTMTAFTHENTRTIKVMGTKGEIRGHMDHNALEVYTFGNDQPKQIDLNASRYGHGGGDHGIMSSFVQLLNRHEFDQKSLEISIQAHLLAFMAEASRLENRIVFFDEFVKVNQ